MACLLHNFPQLNSTVQSAQTELILNPLLPPPAVEQPMFTPQALQEAIARKEYRMIEFDAACQNNLGFFKNFFLKLSNQRFGEKINELRFYALLASRSNIVRDYLRRWLTESNFFPADQVVFAQECLGYYLSPADYLAFCERLKHFVLRDSSVVTYRFVNNLLNYLLAAELPTEQKSVFFQSVYNSLSDLVKERINRELLSKLNTAQSKSLGLLERQEVYEGVQERFWADYSEKKIEEEWRRLLDLLSDSTYLAGAHPLLVTNLRNFLVTHGQEVYQHQQTYLETLLIRLNQPELNSAQTWQKGLFLTKVIPHSKLLADPARYQPLLSQLPLFYQARLSEEQGNSTEAASLYRLNFTELCLDHNFLPTLDQSLSPMGQKILKQTVQQKITPALITLQSEAAFSTILQEEEPVFIQAQNNQLVAIPPLRQWQLYLRDYVTTPEERLTVTKVLTELREHTFARLLHQIDELPERQSYWQAFKQNLLTPERLPFQNREGRALSNLGVIAKRLPFSPSETQQVFKILIKQLQTLNNHLPTATSTDEYQKIMATAATLGFQKDVAKPAALNIFQRLISHLKQQQNSSLQPVIELLLLTMARQAAPNKNGVSFISQP